MIKYNSRIIIACDFATQNQLQDFLTKMNSQRLFLKLGMSLLYSAGFEIISDIKKAGHNVFVDLKLHDIPSSVTKALASLAKYDPDFLTVHALGGKDMLHKSVQALQNTRTKVLAVSVLTSIRKADLETMHITVSTRDMVAALMEIAGIAGVDGVVCSGYEVEIARKHNLITVVPGIRPRSSPHYDQQRVMNPEEAIRTGANFLVIGRPITESPNPLATYKAIQKMIGEQ